MGQSRGFYQGRNPKLFLHKTIWELYEFVPPIPIIMHLLYWQYDGRKPSNFLWYKTGFTAADWCTQVIRDCIRTKALTTCGSYPENTLSHTVTHWSHWPSAHHCSPLREIRNCVGPTLHLSHAWIPNSLFQKYYLYLSLQAGIMTRAVVMYQSRWFPCS